MNNLEIEKIQVVLFKDEDSKEKSSKKEIIFEDLSKNERFKNLESGFRINSDYFLNHNVTNWNSMQEIHFNIKEQKIRKFNSLTNFNSNLPKINIIDFRVKEYLNNIISIKNLSKYNSTL